MKNYYRILNVRQNATEDEIKSSFRVLAKKYHPDRNIGNASAAAMFRDIDEAYNVLSVPTARMRYDDEFRLEEAERTRIKNGKTPPQFVASDAKTAEQMHAVLILGFNDGYEAGYDSAVNEDYLAAGGDENEIFKLRREVSRLTDALDSARNDNAALSRRADEETERALDLQTKLEWLETATKIDLEKSNDSLIGKTNDIVAEIKELLKETVDSQNGAPAVSIAQQERRKQIRESLLTAERGIKRFAEELAEIKAIEDQKRKFADSATFFKSMEELAEEWAKKIRSDRKLAKSTKYGELGLLIWASEKDIDDAFERIQKKYAGDYSDNGIEKLRRAKEAYNTLANPKTRVEYDLSIGYTEQMIADERKLIEENERIQKDYHKKLEAHAFWSKFDALYDHALFGEADAQNELGEMYFAGDVIERDYSHAVYWFREAFEQNYPAAIYNLGVCYRDGLGAEKNEAVAQSLFRQAENLGYTARNKNGKRK